MSTVARRFALQGGALVLFGLFGMVGARSVYAVQLQPDESALRASLDRLAHAWNAPDADAWAREYWPDGELINILGLIYVSPADIRDRTAEILAGPFRGSHFAFSVRRVRFVGDAAAVVDTDIIVTGFRGLPGISTTQPNDLHTRMKHIYERRQGTWRILASQNTAVAPPVKPP